MHIVMKVLPNYSVAMKVVVKKRMNTTILFAAIAIVGAFGIAAVVGLTSATPVLTQDNMTMGDN